MALLAEWFDPATIGPMLRYWSGNILAAIAIFVIGRWIAGRVANAIALATEKAKFDATLTRFLRSVVYMALLVMVAITAVGPLGVEPTVFLTIFGAAGLAIGLALKDSLGNFSSGVMLVFFRPFKVGDYVEAAGIAGTVDSISMFSTEFKTLDNRVVIVPNSMIYAGTITNFSALPTRRIDLVIGLSYNDDVVRAKEVMRSVLEADSRVLKSPAPEIVMLDLAESSVNFAVRSWVLNSDYGSVRGDLLERIKLAIEANGMSIPFPQRDIRLLSQTAVGM